MTSRASSYVDMNQSTFRNVKSEQSKRLTVESFYDDTMVLSAEPNDPRMDLFHVDISKLSGKFGSQFFIKSVFSPEDCVQQLKTMWPTSAEGTNFVVEALSALEETLEEESAWKEQQVDTERLLICRKVFAAYLQLQVKDELDADELNIYQRFYRWGKPDIHDNDINCLAQAIIAEGMHFTKKRRQLLVQMVKDEKAQEKTA